MRSPFLDAEIPSLDASDAKTAAVAAAAAGGGIAETGAQQRPGEQPSAGGAGNAGCGAGERPSEGDTGDRWGPGPRPQPMHTPFADSVLPAFSRLSTGFSDSYRPGTQKWTSVCMFNRMPSPCYPHFIIHAIIAPAQYFPS